MSAVAWTWGWSDKLGLTGVIFSVGLPGGRGRDSGG